MAFDNNFTESLKDKINIVDEISKYVNLKRTGGGYMGKCPFHNDKTPSFSVSEKDQFFNCFGCGKKGDVITFVEEYNNLGFVDAVIKLANDYKIKVPEEKNRDYKKFDYYYSIMHKSAIFFFKELSKKNIAYPYLLNRNIKDDTIKKFAIGYAPPDGKSLYDFLRNEGIRDNDMEALGLITKYSNGGKPVDKFRNRVIFPIINRKGKVIGFGGRALNERGPKYLNSPETIIFKKKDNLFGLNLSQEDIRKKGFAILVEGYMDMISLYQAGVTNVAASLGTALTENQVDLISKYAKEIILSYDSDFAGINATLRAIDIFHQVKPNIKVKVLIIDEGKDPDEYIKSNGKAKFDILIKDAIPATDFRINILKKKYNLNNKEEFLLFIEEIINNILVTLNPVEREIYINKISQDYNISKIAIEEELKKNTANIRKTKDNKKRFHYEYKMDKLSKIEINLILLAINIPEYIDEIKNEEIEFKTNIGIKCFEYLKNMDKKDSDSQIIYRLVKEILDIDEEKIFENLHRKLIIGSDDADFFRKLIDDMKLENFKEEKIKLINTINTAEKMGDKNLETKTAEKIEEIEQKISNIRRA